MPRLAGKSSACRQASSGHERKNSQLSALLLLLNLPCLSSTSGLTKCISRWRNFRKEEAISEKYVGHRAPYLSGHYRRVSNLAGGAVAMSVSIETAGAQIVTRDQSALQFYRSTTYKAART